MEGEEQRAIRNLEGWADKWQMAFNASKCHILYLGGSGGDREFSYTIGGVESTHVENERNRGVVMILSSLKPLQQCTKALSRVNQVLGQLARGVGYRDKDTFLQLYTLSHTLVMQWLAGAHVPRVTGSDWERVQSRAVGMVSNPRGETTRIGYGKRG